MRLVAVGDVLVDVVVHGRGHEARARIAAGGTARNAAQAATAAGAQAEVVGRVGDDPAGRMLRAELVASGADASLSIDPEQRTGTFLVVDGELRVDRGANAAFLPEHLPATLEADVVLVSGHLPQLTVTAALERSRAAWTALAVGRLRELPAGANAVFLDETEAGELTGLGPEAAARDLALRHRLACVTRGAQGVVASLDGRVEAAVPELHVEASGIGAGDAFAAVTLVALARGAALSEALAAGCRAGALALAEPE